jgi:predicted aspartyl protease
MAYATVDFDTGRPYVGRRPRGAVILYGPGGPHGTAWAVSALVDTGADFMHLPDSAAAGVGISLAAASSVRTLTAGGVTSFRQAVVNVEIEGVTVSVPVNFGPNVAALIGRQAIFAVLHTTGFTTTEWLLKWIAPITSATPASSGPGVHGYNPPVIPMPTPTPKSTGETLMPAIVGLIGVLVGSFISTGSNYLLAVRPEQAEQAKTERARNAEIRTATRLVGDQLAKVAAGTTLRRPDQGDGRSCSAASP